MKSWFESWLLPPALLKAVGESQMCGYVFVEQGNSILPYYSRCQNTKGISSSTVYVQCFSSVFFHETLTVLSQVWVATSATGYSKGQRKKCRRLTPTNLEGQGLWWVWRSSQFVKISELRPREPVPLQCCHWQLLGHSRCNLWFVLSSLAKWWRVQVDSRGTV